MNNNFKMLLCASLFSLAGIANAQTCPTISSADKTVSSFTQLTGSTVVGRFSAATEQSTTVDPTSMNSVMNYKISNTEWPNTTGMAAVFNLPNDKYLSMKFTIPAAGMPNSATKKVYGTYNLNESSFSVPVTMTISTACGDFSAPGSTSTVLCTNPRAVPNNGLFFVNYPIASTSICTLHNGGTYYLNVISATVTNGVAKSNAASGMLGTKRCIGSSCPVPLMNGPGSVYP